MLALNSVAVPMRIRHVEIWKNKIYNNNCQYINRLWDENVWNLGRKRIQIQTMSLQNWLLQTQDISLTGHFGYVIFRQCGYAQKLCHSWSVRAYAYILRAIAWIASFATFYTGNLTIANLFIPNFCFSYAVDCYKGISFLECRVVIVRTRNQELYLGTSKESIFKHSSVK